MATIPSRPTIRFPILMAGVGMDPIPMVGTGHGDGTTVPAIPVPSIMVGAAIMVAVVAAGNRRVK